ncbi:MAG: chorismate mutase, partial [Desulfovibrionaceae bacterium]|nr:chorismate mutase [Desulfovibrionaceae bacterium]
MSENSHLGAGSASADESLQESAGMASHEAMLAGTRARIDELDLKLLELLNERSALSKEVGRIKAGGKSAVFKPHREEEILKRLSAHNRGPLPEAALHAIWREIFSSSRSLQNPLRVAYLGPEGTFSYFAGVEYLGHSASFRACNDLQQVFEEVNATTCDLGVVPLENSLQGTVGVSFDLFSKFPVVIQAELYSHISHCLLTAEDSFSAIRTVYSHPQPLAQCSMWLRSHLPQAKLVPVESTAAAAQKVVGNPGTASIGNGHLAEMHRLN